LLPPDARESCGPVDPETQLDAETELDAETHLDAPVRLDPAAGLWRELGECMRQLRRAAVLSLRQVESGSGWRRSALSQAENAKARPSRRLVDYYDDAFGADGLLVSMYSEARVVRHRWRDKAPTAASAPADDAMTVLEASPPTCLRVAPGATLDAEWTIKNAGARPWHGRLLRRVGAYAGPRVITSAPRLVVPPVEPGDSVEISCRIEAPQVGGAVIAYWQFVDERGAACFADQFLATLLTVQE